MHPTPSPVIIAALFEDTAGADCDCLRLSGVAEVFAGLYGRSKWEPPCGNRTLVYGNRTVGVLHRQRRLAPRNTLAQRQLQCRAGSRHELSSAAGSELLAAATTSQERGATAFRSPWRRLHRTRSKEQNV